VERTATPRGALTSQLNDVACMNQSTCIAVGLYDRSGRQFTLAEAWDGTAWSIMPTPSPSGAHHSELDAIACPSLTTCIAVGDSGIGSALSPLAEAWDGSSWTLEPVPAPPGAAASQLVGLDCSTPRTCTAVGARYDDTERTLVEGWDGTAWKVQRSPNPKRAFAAVLSGVSCTAASACIAVGYEQRGLQGARALTLAEGWNGSVWTIERTPNPKGSTSSVLHGIFCLEQTQCTAVGSGDGTLAEVWNGSDWIIQATPNPPGGFSAAGLSDLACGSPSVCTAVGLYFPPSGGPVALAERWNGSSWLLKSAPKLKRSTGNGLYALACPRTDACTAVGFRGTRTLAEGR
jgi:hypothetical protein